MKTNLKKALLLQIFFCFLLINNSNAQGRNVVQYDSISQSIQNIRRYINNYREWYPQDYEMSNKIRSLVNYVRDEKMDSVIIPIENYRIENQGYFFRTVENVSDSLKAPGYISNTTVIEQKAKINRQIRADINPESIEVPETIIAKAQLNVKLISSDEINILLESGYVVLPDSLKSTAVSESDMTVEEFNKLQRLDGMRQAYLENARIEYNAKIMQEAKDSIVAIYRENTIAEYSRTEQEKYHNYVKNQNRQKLTEYNNTVTKLVNDSIDNSLRVLLEYVNNERIVMWLSNSTEDSVAVLMSNNRPIDTRIFVKNIQNDSLALRAHSTGRNSLALYIEDDAVSLTRFQIRENRKMDMKIDVANNLGDFDDRYEVVVPWTYGSQTDLSFAQTYLKNWIKGGETSLATLLTFKGYLNYKLDKIEWSNTIDVRNGWLSPSDGGIEKNEDKFQIISNFGIRAYHKWYYTAEADLQTQLFNSYNYPDRENPKSGFLAPVKTMFKLGMDLKQSKELSLLISPITMKHVYVRNIDIYDQTKFGIEEGKKSLLDIGLNFDVTYKKTIENISLESKYKMFMDYQNLFRSYDIDWENTVNFKINDFMKAKVILHILYDDNVTFDTGKTDANGDAIKKAKVQFKEFVSFGFTYSFKNEIKRRRPK